MKHLLSILVFIFFTGCVGGASSIIDVANYGVILYDIADNVNDDEEDETSDKE